MRRLERPLAVAAALAALPWALGLMPLARFTRERIELEVRPGALVVDGRYVYENPLPVPVTQGLEVPFFTDDAQAAPATISAWRVHDDGRQEDVPVRWVLGRAHLAVTVPARGAAALRVRFEQRCSASRATYLLTTTRPWRRPLVEAEYVLRLDRARLARSSLPLAPAGDALLCVRRDFMPDTDWRVEWTCP